MFCPNCGKQMNDNAKFCVFCGAPMADEKVPAESQISTDTDKNESVVENQSNGKKISDIVTGVLTIAVGCALVWGMIVGVQWAFSKLTGLDYKNGTGTQSTDRIDASVLSKSGYEAPDNKTYSVTFEMEELLEEAGLQLGGHVGPVVLSNLTCSNGNAYAETDTIYIYDSLVRVEVTGAKAGDVVLGGTLTTYGIDMYQGQPVSYPVNAGTFLICKTVGDGY